MKDLFYKNFKPFVKYCIVGGSGTILDVASLYFFVDFLSLPVMLGTFLSFVLAVTNNFILNKIWTFKNKSKNYKKLYVKFLIVSVIGLMITLGLMYIFVFLLSIWYIVAKLLTSAIVLVWNFLANKLWTFRIKSRKKFEKEEFDYYVSVIIPAYNEENRIKETLERINNFIKGKNWAAEIIVVDDGSRDNTVDIVKSYKEGIDNLKVIELVQNRGKGFAVKSGIGEARGEYIVFTDADNSTPIEEFDKLFNNLKESSVDVAIGSRYLKNSNVEIKQPRYRVILGRIGNLLIKSFLIDGIEDTQCGFKLFRNHAAKDIFFLQRVKRFGFDMEVLVIAKNLGYKVSEIPVSWFNSSDSRLRPVRDGIITLKDLIFIKANLWLGVYDRD